MWSQESENPSMSRIDKSFGASCLEGSLPGCDPKASPRVVSDHCPLLVEASGMSRGKSSFKFEYTWLKVQGFVDQVRCWWDGHHFVGPPSLAYKFKALKGDLKHWNKHIFGDIF